MAQNRFSVCDVDGDGREELILLYTTTIVAGERGFVYDWDEATGELRKQLEEFPLLTFYDNGAVMAGWSHNQGNGGSFWPYFLYQYLPETDSYQQVGAVDAWDKALGLEGYPDEVDASKTGFVYYITTEGDITWDHPVDASQYQAWLAPYLGEARELSIPYVELTAENGFRLTPEQLKAAITPRTKALVLPFPSNPTGGIMERRDLEAIAQVLKDNDIMVISDEIYAELTYGQRHVSPANLTQLYDRTVVVNGFSKSHAMTGWRMGYVCAPQPVIAAMTKLHQFGIMSAPTTSQYAAIEAMRSGDEDIAHMREEYDSRRRYLVENLNRIGLDCFEPKGAFYVFPCIRSSGLSSDEFCERFLREEKVAVIPGTAFGPGGEGYVRACYASSMRDLTESISRLDNFLQNLRRKQGQDG